MKTKNGLVIPSGRLGELLANEDAPLLAYSRLGNLGEDCKVRRFNSRAALEAFCKDGSALHALVKTPRPKNCITNRNTQREA